MREDGEVFQRIPLEDMRELWYWGAWKESVPMGYSTSVVVLCTSRDKCRRYWRQKSDDSFLLEEDEEHPPNEKEPLFDEEDRAPLGSDSYPRRFRRISYDSLFHESSDFLRMRDVTLLINPYNEGSGPIKADGIYRVDEYIASASMAQCDANVEPEGHRQDGTHGREAKA